MSILIIITFLLITGFDFTPDFSLSGRHFKFVAFDVRIFFVYKQLFMYMNSRVPMQNPPFDSMVKGPNGTLIFSGVTTDVVFWIAQRLKFTYV